LFISHVNIFAPMAQKTAKKKRNSGVCRVYSPLFFAPLPQEA
jgi:hypothetical protein